MILGQGEELIIISNTKVKVLIAISYLTLCDSMDYSPSGSSVQGISQVRVLEQVAILYSRGSPRPRDGTCTSCISALAGRFFTTEPPEKPS